MNRAAEAMTRMRGRLGPPSRLAEALRVCVFAFLLGAVPGLRAFAQTSSAAFDAANRLYEQGKFSEAAASYENLLRSGQASAALYFNLGNAFFKGGQMGRAIAAYRHAEKLSPRDPDLRANLQFARNQIQGPTLASSWWQRWLAKLSLNEWTWLAAASIWLLFLALTLRQWRPGWKQDLRTYTLLLAAVALMLCAGFGGAFYLDRCSPEAIVIAREAAVRQGPLDEAPTAFTARDGSELKVLDRKDEWLQVTADSRRIGWVHRDQVLLTPGV